MDSNIGSYLAILARLEVLHRSPPLARASHSRDDPVAARFQDLEVDSAVASTDRPRSVEDVWEEAAGLFKTLGDGLRDEHLRIPLGQTSLPSTLADLLLIALDAPARETTDDPVRSLLALQSAPSGNSAAVIVEICRVSGNMCFDCEDNRNLLLEYAVPMTLLSLVKAFTKLPVERLPFLLVRSVLGALLNISLDHEPTQRAIAETDGAVGALLEIAEVLCASSPAAPAASSDRFTVAGWIWKIVSELAALEPLPSSFQTSDIVSLLCSPFQAFLSLESTPSSSSSPPLALILQVIDSSSKLLEKITDKSAPSRSAVGRCSLSDNRSALALLLDFIKRPSPSPSLAVACSSQEDESSSDSEEDEPEVSFIRALAVVKGALVKAVVAVTSEDEVADALFQEGWLVALLKEWLSDQSLEGVERDDLLICTILLLGNLARTEAHCVGLLAPDVSILPQISPLLSSNTDTKLKHALVGLLKNLSIPAPNKAILGDSDVMQLLVNMGCLSKDLDEVQSVQGGCLGVIKNACKGSASNSLRVVLPEQSSSDPILTAVLDFLSRATDFALRCEAARVLSNLVRSLFAQNAAGPDLDLARGNLCSSKATADALVGLARGGITQKFEVLVGEGVLALALMAGASEVAALNVSSSLLALPVPGEPTSPSPGDEAETGTANAFQLLVAHIGSPSTSLEMKANILTLFGAAGRADASSKALCRTAVEGVQGAGELVDGAKARAISMLD